jgi:ribosomal-protein-alanine N-acetyltransferase
LNKIETERTALRGIKSTDLSLIRPLLQDEQVMAKTGFKRIQSEHEIIKLVEKWQLDRGVWLVFDKESSDFVGWFMLKNTISDVHPEIGFMLCRSYWGRGYATEVASEVIHYALTYLGKTKVIASVDIKYVRREAGS